MMLGLPTVDCHKNPSFKSPSSAHRPPKCVPYLSHKVVTPAQPNTISKQEKLWHVGPHVGEHACTIPGSYQVIHIVSHCLMSKRCHQAAIQPGPINLNPNTPKLIIIGSPVKTTCPTHMHTIIKNPGSKSWCLHTLNMISVQELVHQNCTPQNMQLTPTDATDSKLNLST